MRDRFSLVVVGAVALLLVLGYFAFQAAQRGAFADHLSTFRSEPDGARALYLLLQESGIAVARRQVDLSAIEPGEQLMLLGTRFDRDTWGSIAKAPDAGGHDEESEAGHRASDFRAPPLTEAQALKLLAHVSSGATLVYAPAEIGKDDLLDMLKVSLTAADTPREPVALVPAQPSPYTRGVDQVYADVASFVELPEGAVPLLVEAAESRRVVLGLVPHGDGRVIVLSAPALATNRALPKANNAQFWVSLARAISARGTVAFDEYHHGFTQDRSIGAFAMRYGLHLTIAQLLVGVALWSLALRRFGRPRQPQASERVERTDALLATSRLYREGRHHAHAATAIAHALAHELASVAGMSGQPSPHELSAALSSRGRRPLAAALLEVARLASDSHSDSDVQHVARSAALARLKLHSTRPERSPDDVHN